MVKKAKLRHDKPEKGGGDEEIHGPDNVEVINNNMPITTERPSSSSLAGPAGPKHDKTERLKREARQYRDEIARRGVVYLSSLPPYMKPAKVKHLLEKMAPVTRLYMVEEDVTIRKRRIKGGGNKKKKYVEGWVEFQDKKMAKEVAGALNGSLVGGKKHNFYHDDMWVMKYLRGFKWSHLTEKLAYERRVREQKLRMEMLQAKKENAAFVGLVEKKKELEGMEERRRKEGKEGRRRDDEVGEVGEGRETRKDLRVLRRFRQVAPLRDGGERGVAAREGAEGLTGEGLESGGKKRRCGEGMDKELLKAVFQEARPK